MPSNVKNDPEELIAFMNKFRITRIVVVPSLLRALISIANQHVEMLNGNNIGNNNSSNANNTNNIERNNNNNSGGLAKLVPTCQLWTTSGEALLATLAHDFFHAMPKEYY